MEESDIKIGEIYYNKAFNSKSNYIFKLNGLGPKINGHIHYTNDQGPNNGNYSSPGGSSFHDMESVLMELRVATEQEKAWLLACEKADKFIPLSEIEYNTNEYTLI